MTPADMAAIRQLIREELAAFRLREPIEEIQMDADHMARMILSGRGAEVKASQRLKMQQTKIRRAA